MLTTHVTKNDATFLFKFLGEGQRWWPKRGPGFVLTW